MATTLIDRGPAVAASGQPYECQRPVAVGFKIRWAAGALVVFCLGTAFGVHLAAGDFNNMIHFYKNLVMAGGFLYVMTYGAGAMSIDGVDEA